MWTDEIVEEIHRIREEYAKSLNDDLEAIFADLRRKEAQSGRKVVDLSQKSHSSDSKQDVKDVSFSTQSS
ncbi:hypothetical protein LEP3755_22630 [Leptolyngbya sp. NIES-3755]|nr:hypothetical protein LEP3755_22630 [Leptolyngbya sp. NIES-3755]